MSAYREDDVLARRPSAGIPRSSAWHRRCNHAPGSFTEVPHDQVSARAPGAPFGRQTVLVLRRALCLRSLERPVVGSGTRCSMFDILFLLVTVAFFALSLAYVRGCDGL